jgi:hypothetical protein
MKDMSLKKHKYPIAAAAGLAMLLTTVGFGALPANASTTCTVTNNADSGAGTQRECLADFNSTTTTGQIDIGFDPSVTEITLESSLEINHDKGSNSSTDIVVIDGTGTVTLKGDGSDFALLDIKDAYFVTLKGLTFSGARHTGNGGAVLVSDAGGLKGGTLLIEDTTFDDNQAANGAGVYWAGNAGSLKFEEGDLETGNLLQNVQNRDHSIN